MIDPAKIGQAPEPAVSCHEASLSQQEAEGRKDEFRGAMRQDAEKSRPEGDARQVRREMGGREERGEAPMPPPFSGDALLRGLGASYTPIEAQQAAAPGSQDASTLAAELAERILVSTDNRAGGSEVRIALKDSVLQDTEIILRREGERLVVQLASGNPASLDALRLAQDDLRNKLLALDRDISVEVLDSRDREGEDESGHSHGRSRGLDYFTESES